MTPAGILPEPLPSGNAAGGARAGAREPQDHGAAWQRELERARVAGWLMPVSIPTQPQPLPVLPGLFHAMSVQGAALAGVDGSVGAALPQAQHAPLPATQPLQLDLQLSVIATGAVDFAAAGSAPAAIPQLHLVHVTSSRQQGLPPETGPGLPMQGPAATAATQRSQAPSPGLRMESAGRAAAAAPATPSSAPQPPVRLHAEWSADGVRLWLGLDAQLQGQVAAIAAQVRRWMSVQGVPVIEFSCNGQPLDDTVASPHQQEFKERSWPSAQ